MRRVGIDGGLRGEGGVIGRFGDIGLKRGVGMG